MTDHTGRAVADRAADDDATSRRSRVATASTGTGHGTGHGARSGEEGGEAPPPTEAELVAVARVAQSVLDAVESVIEGKPDVVRTAVTVLLAGGHLLIEDVPGLGKTMLTKSLARAIRSEVRRIQFTPDLMPSDITGLSVYNPESRTFEFRPGAVFANVVIGDEINRASPKTQSALLEAMEEHQVTADGVTHTLPSPFMVVATQNPAEMDGTYPLPEAQRDRFMARISMGYPTPDAEAAMLTSHGSASPLDDLEPVTTAGEVAELAGVVRRLWASPALVRYVVDVVGATRDTPALRLGASPRAGLHLLAAARAHAAISRRDHVLPDDVLAVAPAVLAHRVVPAGAAATGGRSTTDIVKDLVRQVPVGARR